MNNSIFTIFSDYFNFLKENPIEQKKINIQIKGFLTGSGKFLENLCLIRGFEPANANVLLLFEGELINLNFDIYKSNGEIFYDITLHSEQPTILKEDYVYDTLFKYAVEKSELKGSYLVFADDRLQWTIEDLDTRDFNDIFLPNKSLDDLILYIKVALSTGEPMRYLLVGNPGTGKTESCLVLANELNKQGVTIIKTSICDAIAEKIQLAEILKPSILIFDDIDLTLGSRSKGAYSNLLRKFLDALDGINKITKGVGIIATTNAAHLLDIAAQRPGRFDKIMIFDHITKNNIKDIILKSLRVNFKIKPTSEFANLFITPSIINLYHSSKVSGAHIFNSVYMLKLRIDTLKLQNIDVAWLEKEIKTEIETVDKVKKQQELNDRYSGTNRPVGFGEVEDDEDAIYELIGHENKPFEKDESVLIKEKKSIKYK